VCTKQLEAKGVSLASGIVICLEALNQLGASRLLEVDVKGWTTQRRWFPASDMDDDLIELQKDLFSQFQTKVIEPQLADEDVLLMLFMDPASTAVVQFMSTDLSVCPEVKLIAKSLTHDLVAKAPSLMMKKMSEIELEFSKESRPLQQAQSTVDADALEMLSFRDRMRRAPPVVHLDRKTVEAELNEFQAEAKKCILQPLVSGDILEDLEFFKRVHKVRQLYSFEFV
jgi:hypothetical protein